MDTKKTTLIDQPWPDVDLETVDSCPYCGSKERSLAFADVQDWSFYCAPGRWSYWDCSECCALYMDPRPTQESIGIAYNAYYTHRQSFKKRTFISLKNKIRNCFYYAWYGLPFSKKYKLPSVACYFLSFFNKKRIAEPFVQLGLKSLPVGSVLDVGCGNGANLDFASLLGWKTFGIEIDPNAVLEAQKHGHTVIEGSYLALREIKGKFDCVICSHVLEHVSAPLELLDLIAYVLKPRGTLIIVLPNSLSVLRSEFGASWRGLEAPRHLAIPSFSSLFNMLETRGFEVVLSGVPAAESLKETLKIEVERKGLDLSVIKNKYAKFGMQEIKAEYMDTSKLMCRLKEG